MPYPANRFRLLEWENQLLARWKKDPSAYATWDEQIKSTVVVFNAYLAGKAFFPVLDWRTIKTMTWVESGPFAFQNMWNVRPMQIGNPGDMGMDYLLNSTQAALTTPPQLRAGLNAQNITTEPRHNIIAGVALLMVRMAKFGVQLDPLPICDARSYLRLDEQKSIIGSVEHPIGGCVMDKATGDRIAVKAPTAILSSAHSHHFRKTHQPALRGLRKTSHLGITGWWDFNDWDVIYKRYNGGGDGNYPSKLKFANDIIMGRV